MLMRGFWAASVAGDGGASFGGIGAGAQEGIAAIGLELAKRRHRENLGSGKLGREAGDRRLPPVRMLRGRIAILG